MAKKSKLTHKTQARRMLEARGWDVADVEQWIPGTRIRRDMFGVADLLAMSDTQTLALQVTSANGGNVSSHVKDCILAAQLPRWLRGGRLFEVWGVRNEEVRDGSPVVARCFELSEDGKVVVAFEGSQVLNL